MNIQVEKSDKYQKHLIKFDSLGDFLQYIKKTPTNQVFSDADALIKRIYGENGREYKENTALSSHKVCASKTYWTGTKSLEEAEELLIKGIPDQTEKLMKLLKAEKKMQPTQAMKRVNSIQGFQPVVPLYLMGIPNNMISTQMKPLKQKVVNLYTGMSYLANVSADEINKECIKKFRLISKLESQNYRVNLNLIFASHEGWSDDSMDFISCIRLKSANERLNISKLAFPLTHPSMERRLLFRLVETYPDIIKMYTHGYGRTTKSAVLKETFKDGFVLPDFITKDIEKIN